MGRKFDSAAGLYLEGIRDGRPEPAQRAFAGARYTQHSTGVPTGRDGFIAFFKAFLARNPERDIRILRGFEDGEHVFLHVFQSLNGGESQWLTMDLFDTDEQDRVIEHWDVIQAYAPGAASAASADMADMADGPSAPDPAANGRASKRVVKEYVKTVLTEQRHERLAEFVSENLVQRAAGLGAGRDGLSQALANGAMGECEMLFKLVGAGDMAAAYGKFHRGGADWAVFDLYRVAAGRIAEQWRTEEPIPPRAEWGNAGKF